MNTCNLSSTNRPIWISLKHTNTNRNYHQHFCSKKQKQKPETHPYYNSSFAFKSMILSGMNSASNKNVRPEVLHSVKFGDETKVGLPRFAFVILEKPKSPPGKNKQTNKRLTTEYDHILSTFVRLVVKKNLQTFTTSHILYNSKIHLRRLTLLEYNSLTVFSIFATVIHKVEWYMNVISCIDLYFYKKRQTWINAYLFCSGCLMYVSGFTTFWTAVSHFSVSPFAGTEFDT